MIYIKNYWGKNDCEYITKKNTSCKKTSVFVLNDVKLCTQHMSKVLKKELKDMGVLSLNIGR